MCIRALCFLFRVNINLFDWNTHVIYILYITTITFLGLSSIYIKNEVIATSSEITKLNEVNVSNLNIVKELQSNKEYLLSEKYINEFLGNKMSVVVPETLLIQVDLSK